MNRETFWISEDGIVTTVKEKPKTKLLELTVTFRLRDSKEVRFVADHLESIHFSERSTLARIGLEIAASQPPRLNRDRLILQCEAFLYDSTFPCATYYRELLKPGTAAGRLFYAPESQKLTSGEIW
jgi:hypothetical protein